jgi:uncharacterized protein (UPF0218 family)
MEQVLREEMQKQYGFLVELSAKISSPGVITIGDEFDMDVSHAISQQLLRINAVLNP